MFNLQAPPGFRGLDPNLPVRVYYRHLPHWRQEGATYFVTFRLEDALPQEKLRELQWLKQEWEAAHPPPRSNKDWEDFARHISVKTERWLDEGYGCCCFNQPAFSKLLSEALLFFQNERYFTACFTVMPNHCHLLIQPFPHYELEDILKICKGYVAREINKARKMAATIWQQESYDRIVRDEEHLYRIVQYIGRNPSMARIPKDQWVRWIDSNWRAAGWDFELA
jgi:putative transposase